MLIVVTGVSSCAHIYSVGYMHHDKAIARFMAYLSLFTFAMLMLVTADIWPAFRWGVGWLLPVDRFLYHKESAHTAMMKAFVVNRVGDFIKGILAIFVLTGVGQFGGILPIPVLSMWLSVWRDWPASAGQSLFCYLLAR